MPSKCKANVKSVHKKRGSNPSKCKPNVNQMPSKCTIRFSPHSSYLPHLQPLPKIKDVHFVLCPIYAAQHFMPKLIDLPYPQSRIEGEKLKHDLSPMTELRPRKQLKRLLKWPYRAYYIVEKIRYFKNKK